MSDGEHEIDMQKQRAQEEAQAAEERNQIWQVFMQFDVSQEDSLPTSSLKSALESLGEKVNETQVFRFISIMDPENNGSISFAKFQGLVQQMREDAKGSSDAELLEAYVAMGGEEDGGGCVDADKLIATIKEDFEMTIDIEALIREVDEDGSGEIEFDEFKELLGCGDADGDDDKDE